MAARQKTVTASCISSPTAQSADKRHVLIKNVFLSCSYVGIHSTANPHFICSDNIYIFSIAAFPGLVSNIMPLSSGQGTGDMVFVRRKPSVF